MSRREFRDLSSPEAAREALDALAIEGDRERVPVDSAGGRTLADRIDAPIDVPGFDRSAMDGYALRATDTFEATEDSPETLPVVGTVQAGNEPTATVEAGQAVQVATGAVMPDGADAVVPVERTVERDEAVDVTAAVTPGENVMPRGADIAAGARALAPGTHLGPRHVGLLAALGHETVPVRTVPTVGIVSTGEELVQLGEPLHSAAGQIYDVNSHSVAAAIEETGCRARRYTPASDDEEQLREVLETATTECDLVVTAGSTSAGTADLLYRLVEEEGEILVHGVALKPGRPMLVGHIYETPYVGLPGYPVSALSVFRTLVAPRLHEASGKPESATATVTATLAHRVRYDGGRLRLVAVGLVADAEGQLRAYAPRKGSGATTTLVETDGIVRMAPETTLLAADESVTVERFDNVTVPSLLAVGDPDPAIAAVLDEAGDARLLTLGADDGLRWVEDDIPDLLIAAPELVDDTVVGDPLAVLSREWGLVVPAGNPEDVQGCATLVERDLRVANVDGTVGLRAAFEDALDGLATESPADAIDGYNRELPGIESPARSVAAGRADAGVGLRATTDQFDVDFVPVGRQRVGVYPSPERRGKSSVVTLNETVAESLQSACESLAGYQLAGDRE